MLPFVYHRVTSVEEAIERGNAPHTSYLAGGTELLNWMRDGIVTPASVVDLSQLPLDRIDLSPDEVRIGGLARLQDVASHPVVRGELQGLGEAIEASASPQIRSMGTLAGNLLQRTRCPYFRSDTFVPCNKRVPGSGCSARSGEHRFAAIVGASSACVATHPSDPAVMLAALGAQVVLRGSSGERTIPVTELYCLPGEDPSADTVLAPGELMTHVTVPRTAGTSRYLKLRDRASFDFSLVSAGAAARLEGGRIAVVAIALGGIAPGPWRLDAAERALVGTAPDPVVIAGAMAGALADAEPLPGNRFKLALAVRLGTRVLLEAAR